MRHEVVGELGGFAHVRYSELPLNAPDLEAISDKLPAMARTGWKLPLVLLGAVLVAGFATCGGFYLWLQSNSERLQEEGKVIMKEGGRFGMGKEAPACLFEAVRRLASLDGIVAEASNKVFLESCLKTAKLSAPFCDDVPPRHEIIQSAAWALARCNALGKGEMKSCARLVGAVQERCLATPKSP